MTIDSINESTTEIYMSGWLPLNISTAKPATYPQYER